MTRFVPLLLALPLLASACATHGTAASAPGSTRTQAVRRENVITSQEIMERPELASVADLVRQLRPRWPSAVTVFVNNDPYGTFESLRTLSASNTREVRYLSPSEAQMKWGSRYQAVIQVITK